MEIQTLGRGLVAGWLLDQVDARSKVPIWIGAVISALGLAAAVLLSSWLRGLGLVTFLLGLIGLGMVLLLRAITRVSIHRFASPQSLLDKRNDIDQALAKLDLPKGPFSMLRFVLRLGRGTGAELARLGAIVSELQAELGVDLSLAEQRQAELDR